VFVALIDLPALRKFNIRLFNTIFFEIPQFCQFVHRLNALGPPIRVIVTHTVESVGVLFEKKRNSNESILLETSCKRLDWQLSFVTQITSQLSSFLSGVDFLSIKLGEGFPTGKEDVDPIQWLELFQPFTHVAQVYVLDEPLVPASWRLWPRRT
jgi:hypothetical protein